MTKLYHRDLGLPDEACNAWAGKTWRLDYSAHALQAVLTDRYGLPRRMPKIINFSASHVFEVQEGAFGVDKVCVRIPDTDCDFVGPQPNMDLCLVLIRSHQIGVLTVVTCWFNERTDVHATLDASKYSR